MNPLAHRTLKVALALLVSTAPGVAQKGDYLPGKVAVDGQDYPYLLLTPREVVEGEEYPLFLFLHGAGERGSDNERQKGHFPSRMAGEWYREQFPCYVLAPQCPKRVKWADVDYAAPGYKPEPSDPMRAAIAALGEVVRDHPIDTDRMMLTGLSMGGYGTFDLAARHPDWFTAAAAVCGGASERLGRTPAATRSLLCDDIICCTGYKLEFPFLSEAVLARDSEREVHAEAIRQRAQRVVPVHGAQGLLERDHVRIEFRNDESRARDVGTTTPVQTRPAVDVVRSDSDFT